jgi:hypothetical protein
MAGQVPYVDPALLDYLSRVFPDKCPDEADSSRAIWIAVGAQRVVKHLRKRVNIQTKAALTNEEE